MNNNKSAIAKINVSKSSCAYIEDIVKSSSILPNIWPADEN